MEARRFGFAADLPPAFKFDPTDSDIVTHYLLPRALGLQSEYEHAIIDDDPGKCPPWELMRRHGHAGSDHAFFFAPPRNPVKKERANRAVPPGEEEGGDGVGGVWRGQKGQVGTLFLTRGCAGGDGEEEEEIEIKYKRFNLTYYRDGEDKKTSGWVMHEYQIVQPPLQPGAVLARVKITDAAKKSYRQQQRNAAEAVQMFVPHQVQPVPGPSGNYYHAAAMASDGAQAGAVDQGDDGGGVIMGEEPTFSYADLINACQGDYYGGDNSYFAGDMSNHFDPYYSGGELAT